MAGLSKSRILQHRQCPKRLWLYVNRPELADVSDDGRARMAMGERVGELARAQYPGGVLIDEDDLGRALARTTEALRSKRRPTLFEATLEADNVLVRADVLAPVRGGYRLIEVKSSTSVKDYHYDDVTVQAWVTRRTGVPIRRVELAHINNQFVYPGGGDYQGLFAHVELTADVTAQEAEVPHWISAAQQSLAGDEPDIQPGAQCTDPFECPFMHYCWRHDDSAYPPEILPHGGRVAAALRAEGYTDLRDVPEDRLSNARHVRIWRVTRSGRAMLDAGAATALQALSYPRYYLDFETIAGPIPIWAGTRPYQAIPFQWSCHVERRGGAIDHREFLADDDADPRRAFAESLLAAIGKRGPILVYHAGFERGCLLGLADAFPDLAPGLEAAAARLVDLLPIARDHYYHPDMRGSWSLKAVLPTIAPELAYDDLEVADGGMAQQAFAEILDRGTAPERRQQLREALLIYCERDTWAMVRMAHYFEGRGNNA